MRTEPTARRPIRLPPGLRDVVFGVLCMLGCAATQLTLPTAVVTCARGADGTTSCLIEKQILFGAFSTGREGIHGVTGARTIQWDNRSKRDDYSVALITDRGEQDLGVPSSERNALAVTRAVTRHLERDASGVDAVLQPSLSRQFHRIVLLIFMALGVWWVVHGVRGWRHPSGDRRTNT